MVDVKPLRARVGAVSPVLFRSGEGCGACYKVKCLDKSVCSRRAVTVIVTDECPGGYCSGGNTHFDLSGAAFGRMAVAGEAGMLRNKGELPVVFRRYSNKIIILLKWRNCMGLNWSILFTLCSALLYSVFLCILCFFLSSHFLLSFGPVIFFISYFTPEKQQFGQTINDSVIRVGYWVGLN
ncbi:EXPB3 [Linum perenne]